MLFGRVDFVPTHQRIVGYSGAVCPFCANKRVSATNNLAVVFPDIAAQWHVELNGKLTAEDVTFTASTSVWWQAEDAAGRPIEWKAPVSKRTRHMRFMGVLRQRSHSDAVMAAQQAEAAANTREKRRQVRKQRRQIIASASACATELAEARAAAYEKWQKRQRQGGGADADY